MTQPAQPVPAGIYAGPLTYVGPSDPRYLGMTAMSGDPGVMPSSAVAAAGKIYLVSCNVAQALQSTAMFLSVTAAGVGIVSSFMGVYDANLNLLAQTADISAALQSVQLVKAALTAALPPQSVGGVLNLAFLIGNGSTTPPTLSGNRSNGTAVTTPRQYLVSTTTTNVALPASLAGLTNVDPNGIPFIGLGN